MGNICVKGEQTETSTAEGLRANVELSPTSRERTQEAPKPPREVASQANEDPTPVQQQTTLTAEQNPLFDATMADASNLIIVLGASVSCGIPRPSVSLCSHLYFMP